MLNLICDLIKRILLRDEFPLHFSPVNSSEPLGSFPDGSGIYIHIPFCTSFCPYCPYLKYRYRPEKVGSFIRALKTEAEILGAGHSRVKFDSVYFGGGTPTLISEYLPEVVNILRRNFRVDGPLALETSPSQLEQTTVETLAGSGFTMLSVGVQSLDDRVLRAIGRKYTALEARQAVRRALAFDFATVNVDLMFAVPGQTVEQFEADLLKTIDLGPDQITCYPLFTFPYASVRDICTSNRLGLPDGRLRRRMYYLMSRLLEQAGFKRTSVWSFTQSGHLPFSSVTRQNYLGLGPGAVTFSDSHIWMNDFKLESYQDTLSIQSTLPIVQASPMSARLERLVWLYWRLYESEVPLDQYRTRYGRFHWDALLALTLAKLLGAKSDRRSGRIKLSARGCHWIHLMQNHLVLKEVAQLWNERLSLAGREVINL